jgi:hypothetical protein
MTDKGPEIRKLARVGAIRYTQHAIERIKEYKLTTAQVNGMLKNCTHNQTLDDNNGHRVAGRAPSLDETGTVDISAHIKLVPFSSAKKILVITVINN